jgi:hypothetical protein
MTEETPATDGTTPGERNIDIADSGGNDLLLIAVVSMIDGADDGSDDPSAISLTVTVPGGIVSGVLVPRRWWAEKNVRDLGAVNEMFAEATENLFASLAPDPDDAPNFLHLRDARFVHGGRLATTGLLWRSRLADVTGWSFAQLGNKDD